MGDEGGPDDPDPPDSPDRPAEPDDHTGSDGDDVTDTAAETPETDETVDDSGTDTASASPADVDPDTDADVVEFSATGDDIDDAGDPRVDWTERYGTSAGSDDADGSDDDKADFDATGPFDTPGLSSDERGDEGDAEDDGAWDRSDAVVGEDDGEWDETDAVVGEDWDGSYADEEVETGDWSGPYAPGQDPDAGTPGAEAEPWADRQAAETEGVGANPGSSPAPSSPSPAGTGAGGGVGVGGPGGAPAAPDDQEMPLTEHIEEMVTRLGVVLVVMALVSGVVFPFADRLINFLWYSFLPGTIEQCPVPPSTVDPNDVACPTLYHPLALMFARLKIASLAGFVVALPVMVYESYLFMRPGLYPRERRYYLASVPTSLVLAMVGVVFAYFLVLPVLFQYFTGYTSSAATIAFGLTDTFNLIVMMLGFFALVFQIPLLVMLAIMMGVTSRRWLADKRLYFWGGFATVAFIFSPDPTGMAPILVAVTMIGLFEGTLFLLRWTGN